jgi:hypothetical protein
VHWHIDRWKNDTVRKGHYPALGRSKDPALDIVAELQTWLRVAKLAVHAACAKRTRPAANCEVCPPLIPFTRCAQGGVTLVTDWRQQVSYWIRWATQSGGDSTHLSGISARKGCISASQQRSRRVSSRQSCTCKAAMVRFLWLASTCTRSKKLKIRKNCNILV